MGEHKKERTSDLFIQAKNRYLNELAQNDIEQHKFDMLVNQGVIVRENPSKPQENSK